MKNFKTVALAATCTALLGGAMTTANAANWLMLQGTERADQAPRAKVWGFLQPTYLQSGNTKLPTTGNPAADKFAGQDSQFNTHQPNLASNSTFQIMRARLGVRGVALPLDNKVNYFLLAEMGNNGITSPGGGGGSVKLSDASVTLNYIKGMRVRVGQMKVPMAEELYQGIMTFNYINPSNVGNQQLIERHFWTDGTTACIPGTSGANYLRFCNGDLQTQFRGSAVAVRDTGIQLFDTFKSGAWEHSYAVLLGNGGVGMDNRDNSYDTTAYWSSEKVFSGKGPWRDHMKFLAWSTKGKRTLYSSAILDAGGSLESAEKTYDRNLSGLGFIYQRNKIRFWTEYIAADGMIFTGSTAGGIPGAVSTSGSGEVAQFTMAPTGKSSGYYLDFGYKITPKIELDVRYDVYNRVTNLAAAAQRDYVTTTLGLQYKFNKKTKLLVNYEMREFNAPAFPSAAPPNKVAATIEDKISAQLFVLF